MFIIETYIKNQNQNQWNYYTYILKYNNFIDKYILKRDKYKYNYNFIVINFYNIIILFISLL
jgi:hypothetical protein